MITEDNILARIDELLKLCLEGYKYDIVGEVYSGTIAITTQLWGVNSPQLETVKQLREDMRSSKWVETRKANNITLQCQGVLRSIASDIRAGRLGNIRLESQGQVFADIINVAKVALGEGTKDVAAVLAATALEDTLKRYGQSKGLDVEDKDLSTVVNALKSVELISATQASILKGMVPFRNKALNAEWSKINTAEVQGVLAFIEEFLIKQFV